jgi:hypothetical protein
MHGSMKEVDYSGRCDCRHCCEGCVLRLRRGGCDGVELKRAVRTAAAARADM